MNSYENILEEIKSLSNKELAIHHSKFFKTSKGEYGEGDLFLGLSVPPMKDIAKKYYQTIDVSHLEKLLKNPYHEIRFTALSIMLLMFDKGTPKTKAQIFDTYMNHLNYINNWDLVDVSAYKIVGRFCFENQNNDYIYNLSASKHLWSERISVISTLYFIKKGDFSLIKELSTKFLTHKHDLMHKAVGWMLREMGKKDINELHIFLYEHHKNMPRTMLRYAIEKLPQEKRKYYMS